MEAPRLDRRLILRHRVLAAPDANGQQVESFTAYATVWGRKIHVSGREFISAQTKDAENTVRFEVRYRDDIVATDRLTCEGVDYQLVAPPSEIGRRDGLTLFTTAVING